MATFGKVVREFDGSGDLAEAQREVIDSLEDLAESKAALFKSEIDLLQYGAGEVDKRVPISAIIDSKFTAAAFSSTSSDDIPKAVAETIKSFLQGTTSDVIKGIQTILTTAFQVFFGQSSGESKTEKNYFVYATSFAIYRLDSAAWYRTVTAKSIQTKMNKAVAVAYSLSTVDINKITWSDFIGIYSAQLGKEKLTEEQVKAAREEMRDTWNFLKDEMGLIPDAVL